MFAHLTLRCVNLLFLRTQQLLLAREGLCDLRGRDAPARYLGLRVTMRSMSNRATQERAAPENSSLPTLNKVGQATPLLTQTDAGTNLLTSQKLRFAAAPFPLRNPPVSSVTYRVRLSPGKHPSSHSYANEPSPHRPSHARDLRLPVPPLALAHASGTTSCPRRTFFPPRHSLVSRA